MSTEKPTSQDSGGSAPDKPVEKPAKPVKIGGHSTNNPPAEIGGRKGPDPARYGDWEHNGKCVDF